MRSVCACYRVRFNEALLPFIFGAVQERREEERLKCQLCTGVGELPSTGPFLVGASHQTC